jgi:hypothetical protein
MDKHKISYYVASTVFLAGICSCDPDGGERLLDDQFNGVDAPGEIDSNEPETAEVIKDPHQADFNGDGYADLAVGVPFDDVNGDAAGSVNVIYGSATGLRTTGLTAEPNQIWNHDNIGITGVTSDPDDRFGQALAAGDFDGDGVADLAIGAASDDEAGPDNPGSVTILYGVQGVGLTTARAQIWTQASVGIGDGSEGDDGFGFNLATGDFDGDHVDDLAIGAPGEDIGSFEEGVNAGAVNVIYGVKGVGLTAAGSQFLHRGTGGLTGEPGATDLLGWALAAGDFDEDGNDDLAIGVPRGDLSVMLVDVGVVHVVYGSSGGLSTTNNTVGTPNQQLWHQNVPGIEDTAELHDQFGSALAAGDFDRNGADDLAIGTLFEDVNGDNNAGAVNVIYGADIAGVEGTTEAFELCGAALTVGNFDGNTRDDLAIGCPAEDVGTDINAGSVNVLYGTGTSGLSSSGDERWHQDTPGVLDSTESSDYAGDALSSGDFDNDGASDLVIGVAHEGLQGPISNGGAVNVLYGNEGSGLDDARDQLWHQNRTDAFGEVAGVAGVGEHFGAALVGSPQINVEFDD